MGIYTESRGAEIHEARETQGQILSEFHAWIRGYTLHDIRAAVQSVLTKTKWERVKQRFFFF